MESKKCFDCWKRNIWQYSRFSFFRLLQREIESSSPDVAISSENLLKAQSDFRLTCQDFKDQWFSMTRSRRRERSSPTGDNPNVLSTLLLETEEEKRHLVFRSLWLSFKIITQSKTDITLGSEELLNMQLEFGTVLQSLRTAVECLFRDLYAGWESRKSGIDFENVGQNISKLKKHVNLWKRKASAFVIKTEALRIRIIKNKVLFSSILTQNQHSIAARMDSLLFELENRLKHVATTVKENINKIESFFDLIKDEEEWNCNKPGGCKPD